MLYIPFDIEGSRMNKCTNRMGQYFEEKSSIGTATINRSERRNLETKSPNQNPMTCNEPCGFV